MFSLFSQGAFSAESKPHGKSLVKVTGDVFATDFRYNSDNNFLKKNVYKEFNLTECYAHPDLNDVLQKLAPLLKEKNLKLTFWDCYRPLEVQKAMWKIVPDSRYVANPKVGSNHNRGIAVDATLSKPDGTLLMMPTEFDDFTAKASPNYACKADEKERCDNRKILIDLMAQVGLKPLNSEWWHYQLPNTSKYPLVEKLP